MKITFIRPGTHGKRASDAMEPLVGGYHPTFLPDEAGLHSDAVAGREVSR